MNKTEKQNYINEMKSCFDKNDSILVTHYQGLSVKQLDELRSEMRKNGIIFKITKNRITKLALKGTPCQNLEKFFTGPTAIAFSDDGISSAKILTNFSKTNKNLKILGGIMAGELLEVKDVSNIATLPNLEEARGIIVGILKASAQKILSILLAPGSKLAILAHEKSIKS